MDRISALPEDLLLRIVSSISLIEALRIGAVSRPCRGLWQFSTGSLNFDASNSLMLDVEKLLKERDGYVQWITRILNSHKAPTIDELRVCCDLTGEHSRDIDRWIDIASMKRVKRLELDFEPCVNNQRNREYDYNYQFGSKISGSSFLTSLRLKHVGVSSQMLESFLSDCPSLETLHIAHSGRKLTDINVCGSSLRLKHLHIFSCIFIRRIEVYAPNLLSFEYGGVDFTMMPPSIDLKYVPQLRDACFGDQWFEYSPKVFPRCLETCASQLVNLSLKFCFKRSQVRTCPNLPNLRYLTYDVELIRPSERELLCLLPLIPSSPVLLKFKFRLNILGEKTVMERRELRRLTDLVKKEKLIVLPKTLREVEILGFVGSAQETIFLIYLVSQPTLNLDHLVIDHHRLPRAGPVDQQRTKILDEVAGTFAHYLLSEYYPLRRYIRRSISKVSFGTSPCSLVLHLRSLRVFKEHFHP